MGIVNGNPMGMGISMVGEWEWEWESERHSRTHLMQINIMCLSYSAM